MSIAGLHQISADRFELAGRELVMIQGGRIALGLDQPIRTALERAAPPASFAAFDREGVIDNLEREPRMAGASFTPARVVTLAPFLIEREVRPFLGLCWEMDDEVDVDDVLALACEPPWQLPTLDEWEHVYSAGARTLFPWGDMWPGTDGCPVDVADWTNRLGIRFTHSTECTNDRGILAGGDPDGWNLNGFDGGIVYASAYVMHRDHVAHFEWEAYEASGVRRIIRLPL